MNENNQPVRWGTVRVVPVEDLPRRANSKYQGLYQDISLRLEQTPVGQGLIYPFDDQKTLKAAVSAMKKMFKGKGVVVLCGPDELCVYNTVAPARHTSGPRGPRKIGLSNDASNGHGNGRKLESVPTAADLFEPGPDDDID